MWISQAPPAQRTSYVTCCIAAIAALAITPDASADRVSRTTWRTIDAKRSVQIPDGELWSGDPLALALTERIKARDVAEGLGNLTGFKFDPGKCGDYELGPLNDGVRRSATQFWLALIEPYTKIVRINQRVDNDPSVLANLRYGETIHEFSIDRGTRSEVLTKISRQLDLQMAMNPHDGIAGEMAAEVGPIRGRMSVNDALRVVIADDGFMIRWGDNDGAHGGSTFVMIEPAVRELVYADMSESECNMGLRELGRVTVVDSRLHSLQEEVATEVEAFDRERIEESGASSVPDLLRFMSQTAFHRGLGYRPTGAQFAELRGLGAQYSKVLINGRPTFASAADFLEGAFDLNTVPLSAVERIEVSPHAASLVLGADAIGGVVNIILREVDRPAADVRYEGANGGATLTRGSVIGGLKTDRGFVSLVVDYSRTSSLLGRERSRWADQDFTRYGSIDYRSTFSAPPNISTLDGSNLPGLSSPIAAVSVSETGVPEYRAGEINLTGLLAWQSIVPEISRVSVSAIGQHDIGSSVLRTEFLLADRSSEMQYGPEIVPQLTLSPDHPQNPFHVPVSLSAALTGLAPPRNSFSSRLVRGVVHASGDMFGWQYETYALHSLDGSKATWLNSVDPALLMQAMTGQSSSPLNAISARPGGSGLFAPTRITHYRNGGTQVTGRVSGGLLNSTLVSGRINAGIDAKREFARYENLTGKLSRDVVSGFGVIELSSVKDVKASLGVRRDDYEDLAPVVSYQYSATWMPTPAIEVRAAYNDAFLAPSFIDLFFPRLTGRTEIFDQSRNEVASVMVIAGGNRSLRPTTGKSASFGLAFQGGGGLRASVDLWQLRLRDRISLLVPAALLSDGAALPERVSRAPQAPEDIAAGRPGRLLTLDISRANFGATDTRGIDLGIEAKFRGRYGSFNPRLDITYTDRFRFSDLPGKDSPAIERAGVASEYGTITRWRFRGSLSYEHNGWKANVLGRHDVCYDDFNPTRRLVTSRAVCPALTLDMNVSREVGEHVIVTAGASDILDRSPPFSEVNGSAGIDSSQADLVGRRLYLGLSVRL